MPRSVIPYRRIVVAYVSWWLFWVWFQGFILHGEGYDWNQSVIDAFITNGILALAGYALHTSMHYYIPSLKNSLYVLSWSLAFVAICITIQRWLLSQFIPLQEYSLFVNHTIIVRAVYAWFMIGLVAILTWFWVYANERSENEQRKEDASRLARQAELSNLRMQLQPHFLFNSLNSISALVGTQPEKARQMIQQLSDFLRGTVKKDERSVVTLQEELHHMQLYLDIEKVRFGHRLDVHVDVDDSSLTKKIPPLLLQPVVENAIKFGLYDTVGEITIDIKTRVEKSSLILEVKNPFDPATTQSRPGTGFGLNSIQRRLYLLYFQPQLLTTRQEDNTFVTRIEIPQGS
jgi:two-component system, LytTR family, sensor kinase